MVRRVYQVLSDVPSSGDDYYFLFVTPQQVYQRHKITVSAHQDSGVVFAHDRYGVNNNIGITVALENNLAALGNNFLDLLEPQDKTFSAEHLKEGLLRYGFFKISAVVVNSSKRTFRFKVPFQLLEVDFPSRVFITMDDVGCVNKNSHFSK